MWFVSLHIYQMHFKNDFPNDDLHTKVYMTLLSGVSHNPWKLCKLKKDLYSLKQAPHICFEKFIVVIKYFGFFSSDHDLALFFSTTFYGVILLSLYVYDMIITSDDVDGTNKLILLLVKQFDMKDLANHPYFLRIEVAYSPRGYLLSQSNKLPTSSNKIAFMI